MIDNNHFHYVNLILITFDFPTGQYMKSKPMAHSAS